METVGCQLLYDIMLKSVPLLFQISTNVPLAPTHAVKMQIALTLSVLIHVNVAAVLPEMVKPVQVIFIIIFKLLGHV